MNLSLSNYQSMQVSQNLKQQNSTSIKSQNNYDFNPRVSFCGSRNLSKNLGNHSNDAGIGCLFFVSLIVAPFIMLGGAIESIFTNMNKSATLDDICFEIYSSLVNDSISLKNKTSFNEQKDKTIKILDKYSKNDNYAAFVKEALEFLSENFEQAKIFPNREGYLRSFVYIVYDAAKAAISNNKKIDTKIIDDRIKRAREAMQQVNKSDF